MWVTGVQTCALPICSKVLEFRKQRYFPVADGTLDAIIGAAYLEDIIIDQMAGPHQGLRAIMKQAQFVPQTMPAIKAFESFGFIWGGKWFRFDTMHFEYRPEIPILSGLSYGM
jgi:hypothetical protein